MVARIGDYVADLRVLAEIGLFDDCGAAREDFRADSLNALIAHGPEVTSQVRRRLQQALDAAPTYFRLQERSEIFLLPQTQATLVLPLRIGDYARVGAEGYSFARSASLSLSASEVRGAEVQPRVAFVIGRGVFGVVPVLGFRESGTRTYPQPLYSVLSPWVTPLEALDDAQTMETLQHVPYRRGAYEMHSAVVSVLDPQRALSFFREDGVSLMAGDVVVPEADARFHDGLDAGDAVRYEVGVKASAGDFTLGAVEATIVGGVED